MFILLYVTKSILIFEKASKLVINEWDISSINWNV